MDSELLELLELLDLSFAGFEGFLLLEEEDIETCFLTGEEIFMELEDEELFDFFDEMSLALDEEVTELELELDDFLPLAWVEDLFGDELEWLLDDELLEDFFLDLLDELLLDEELLDDFFSAIAFFKSVLLAEILAARRFPELLEELEDFLDLT